MPYITHTEKKVSLFKQTAVLLLAIQIARSFKLPHPKVAAILQTTGMSRSRAYELAEDLQKHLKSWDIRPRRRPVAPEQSTNENTTCTLELLQFVKTHPGCVHGNPQRQRYSDLLRRFILDLYERYQHLPLSQFARAVDIPLGTLKDWLRGGTDAIAAPSSGTVKKIDPPKISQIDTILAEWRHWAGDFLTFCTHVKVHLRIPFGRTLISQILKKHGLRFPQRRQGRSPDEKALKNSFQTFFPGAQWEGDGKSITVDVEDESFTFNLELMTDCQTSAAVGLSVGDEEDSNAVIQAFADGIKTTGAAPLALALDNKPCNHTESVDLALAEGETLRIRTTIGRPQNKPHVEGAFGLFAQTVPPLSLKNATTPKKLALHVLILIILTWARTLNHKPQKKHQGQSRFERYVNYELTAEEIAKTRQNLEERCKKQLLARETLKARQNPCAIKHLNDAFLRLQLLDPDGNIRSAIARYPLKSILDGIAIFEGKRDAGTLPVTADGRYLRGIVKNITYKNEGDFITEACMRERMKARDSMLTPLQVSLAALKKSNTDEQVLLKNLLAEAIQAERKIDRIFWLAASADLINQRPQEDRSTLIRKASQRIHAALSIPHEENLDMVRFLVDKVMPLD